jgi:four helix bundle protein
MEKSTLGFETLVIWKSFLSQNKKIYHLIILEEHVDWDLFRQTRRAMISVGLNIAEGYSRFYPKEKEQFLNISIASLQEVQACLLIILSLEPKRIDVGVLKVIYEDLEILRRQIIGFKMHIRTKSDQ